ncbi:GIY-YIG nuclease family protein [Xanthobacter tagetidis]|uniref:GIY-YIG nuclease family protein n=1 Tax=Xanthobacter tagetidis TaxID=60216 RepID=A0A3L7AKP5_9HYPH|nr:GIY-YIG nuclease family protein [Xanthobacter tagetidis]MBB6306759.1 putative endonuclease [Xanthobacter tagetidis]RLP80161.1 GIY-YIG nuclease family protein [Xanthobacter tagetidis]
MARRYFVYLLASRPRGTLYVGVTNHLTRRVFEHRLGTGPGFTRRYHVHRLVWFETHDTALGAIQREKRLKAWLRQWKIDLVEKDNPDWRDLFDEIALG